jgi:hypothetical protein
MQFEELEDQQGQQHSEGNQPDSGKSRFQDLLSAPLMPLARGSALSIPCWLPPGASVGG